MQSICAIATLSFLACAAWAQTAAEQAALDQCLANAPAGEGVAHVFYLPKSGTPRELMEFMNLTRTAAEVQFITPCAGVKGVLLRGTAEQSAATEWLIAQIFGPSPGNSGQQYTMSDKWAPVMQVFRLQHVPTQQNVAELVNLLRTTTEIQRVAQLSNPVTIIVRGPAERVAAAEWLVGQLDRESIAPAGAGPQYPMAGPPAPIVGLFYLGSTPGTERISALIKSIRTATQLQRVAWYSRMGAIAARGTTDQLATTERIIGEAKQN